MSREPGPETPGPTPAEPESGATSAADSGSDSGPGRDEEVARTAARPRHLVRWIVLGLLAVLLGSVLWVAVRGLLAANELQALPGLAEELSAEVGGGDVAAAAATARSVADHAHRAASLTGDPIWRLAELVPWAGPNLAAVRVVSHGLDGIGTAGITPLASEAESLLGALQPVDGRLRLEPLAAAAPQLDATVEALDEATDALDGLDRDALVGPLADAVERLDGLLTEARPVAGAAADAATLLPAMLGVDGPRSILLVFQNNAELRTGGGLAGAFTLLRADRGGVSLEAQASAPDFEALPPGEATVPTSTTELFGRAPFAFMQNVTMPPDFTVTGRLAAGWWAERFGTAPDAVVAIDPVVLAALLDVIGPVEAPGGVELTGASAVEDLLVRPYLDIAEDADQNAFFADVTGAVFDALLHRDLDPRALVEALTGPVESGRISAWSAHPEEQERLVSTAFSGPAGRLALAGGDAFGVWLNDATGGKMDVFLDVGLAAATAEGCRPDGLASIVVEVRLANTATPDELSRLPLRFMGEGLSGVPLGSIATDVAVAAPPGSFFGAVELDGRPVLTNQLEDSGFPTALARAVLAPGETSTLRFEFVAAAPGTIEPTLLHTPLMGEPQFGETTLDCR